MGRLSENRVVNIKNKSFSVTADIGVPAAGANGVLIAQGGRLGGWAFYVKDGRAKFVHNVLGIHQFAVEADEPIPAGNHQVRMEFAYDGGGLAKGVSADYTARGSRFTGEVHWVPIDLGLDDHDHFIDPDERLRIAMAGQ